MPDKAYRPIEEFHLGLNDQRKPRKLVKGELAGAVDAQVDENGILRTMGTLSGTHTSSPTDQTITIENTFDSVNIHYSEEDVPTEGATIRVHKKVEIDGVVTEQLLDDNELTDWNGTASFALPSHEYRFLAYHGSPIPAMLRENYTMY